MFRVTFVDMTFGLENESGSSIRFRIQENLATTPGRTVPGSTPAMPVYGRRFLSTTTWATYICQQNLVPVITMAVTALETIFFRTAWLRSM